RGMRGWIREGLGGGVGGVGRGLGSQELEIAQGLHRSGVPFLAGTDTPAGVDVIPGPSLHRELQRFVDAGLTPLQALQTATINPARFLDREAELGTVEAGKLADLLLLHKNPLEDIANTPPIAAGGAAGGRPPLPRRHP